MDNDLHGCQSPTRNNSRRIKWNKLLKVLENESEVLMKQSSKIETRLRNCRLKMRLLRLTTHIDMYGTNDLPSNRSTRNNRKRKVQELESPNSGGWISNHPPKESTDVGGLWTPDEDGDTDGFKKPAPCYVPPVTSNEVDALYAFNFRGDDSRKKILQLKVTARIVPLSMRNIKRNIDVEAAGKALKGYTHKWSLKFTPLSDDTVNFMDKIVVYLHPTCEEQFVVLKFSKRKRSADVSQYGWGSFKVRLMYHFIYPEFNRPVEQLFDLDFIVNQISGFEIIAQISVCDLEKDAINRLRALHTDDKHTITSSESEEDFKSPVKRLKLSEDEECMKDDISFDDIFSDNNIESDPYSGVLFSSESYPEISLNYPDQSSLTDELIDQSLNEFSQYSAAATSIKIENSSQSILTQSDSTSDLSSPNRPKSFDDYIKTEFSLASSYQHSSQSSSIGSTITSGYGLSSDLYSADLLESLSDSRKTILSTQNSASYSFQISSIDSTTSESKECSTMSNIPQNLKHEKNLTSSRSCDLLNPSYSTPQSCTESECPVDMENSPSLLKKISGTEQKTLSKVSEICSSNQELARLLSVQPKTPSNNLSPKPIIVEALAVNSNGKILMKSKLIRIIKAGSKSLLRKPQNSISISKPIPTPNLIPAPNQKQDKFKSCYSDGNLKGELSRKIEKVREAVSGMEFEEALIYCLKNYPIVTKEASSKIYKQLHPYASKSNEEFLSWKFGKRAASMSKHARFIHGILFENYKGESWSWVQVRQYIKYHGYVPVATINGVYNPRRCDLEVTKTSLTCIKQQPNITELRKLRSQMEEATCEVDVDDSIQTNSRVSQISRLHTKSNDRTIKDFTSPEDFELCQWIMRTNEMFNVSVNDEFVPEILMSFFKSFAEYILRRSLAAMMNRKRRHNIIREKDVLTSVLFTDKLRILTEQGLGKKPMKCNIHSY